MPNAQVEAVADYVQCQDARASGDARLAGTSMPWRMWRKADAGSTICRRAAGSSRRRAI